jgi:hypothetical protein
MPFDGKPCNRCKKPMKNRTRYQEICEECKEKRRKNCKRGRRKYKQNE